MQSLTEHSLACESHCEGRALYIYSDQRRVIYYRRTVSYVWSLALIETEPQFSQCQCSTQQTVLQNCQWPGSGEDSSPW